MNEKITDGLPDSAIAAIPQGTVASENEAAALQLRLMMKNAEGEDKCTLCKAAEALENSTPKANQNWALSPIMLALTFSLLDGNKPDAELKTMKSMLDAMSKAIDEGCSEKGETK